MVRIYPPGDVRGPRAAEVDAAVMHLVRGLVPVPDVLEVRSADVAADVPGLLVAGWVEGLRGDLALEVLDEAGRRRMGEEMGRLAATLAGMPTPYGGTFADASLAITRFPVLDLGEWIASHPLPGWGAPEVDSLRLVGERAQDLLDAAGRTCLVHSDLNPKNVLVDAVGRVVAVLDWEYAHSGHPLTDLGNVLRWDREPTYAEAVVDAYAQVRGGRPGEVLDAARAADLWALVDLAAREVRNLVTDLASLLLRVIADSGDLHAWPDSST